MLLTGWLFDSVKFFNSSIYLIWSKSMVVGFLLVVPKQTTPIKSFPEDRILLFIVALAA